MVTSRLFLTGITASGRHGANPGEKDQAQDFVVDLDVEVEVGDDELSSTSDYRTLIRTAHETVERVVKVSAIVHKPAAARSNQVQGVAAAATLER
jgi:dihydroneopterin aldolase